VSTFKLIGERQVRRKNLGRDNRMRKKPKKKVSKVGNS
jgi:hypothetical protein